MYTRAYTHTCIKCHLRELKTPIFQNKIYDPNAQYNIHVLRCAKNHLFRSSLIIFQVVANLKVFQQYNKCNHLKHNQRNFKTRDFL